MLMDFHLHSNTSRDSHMSIREAYEKAAELGIRNICITNHHEPSEVKTGKTDHSLTKEKLDAYKAEIKELKKDRRVRIFYGAEVCYTEKEDRDIRQFLSENDFDFVLCSIHYVNGWMVSDPANGNKIDKKDHAKIIKEYFRLLKKAIKTGLFDVMSHIDLYKRVVPEPDFREVKKQWEEVAELLVKNGVGFEINTSYSKIVPDGTYPRVDVIKIMIEKGVKLITIGSDAHRASEMGRGLQKVEDLLESLGVESVYKFEKRKPIPIDIATDKIKVLRMIK